MEENELDILIAEMELELDNPENSDLDKTGFIWEDCRAY